MRILVTGSSGHLGEALCRVLRDAGEDVVSIDVLPSAHTTLVGSVADRALVRDALQGVDAVLHAATLHKPHVGSHTRQDFVDTNLTGTLNLLEESVAAGVGRFVFTSTTSAFGARSSRRRAPPRPGSPRTSGPSRRTSTARPRPRPRTCASSSTATTACRS